MPKSGVNRLALMRRQAREPGIKTPRGVNKMEREIGSGIPDEAYGRAPIMSGAIDTDYCDMDRAMNPDIGEREPLKRDTRETFADGTVDNLDWFEET